MGFLFRDRPAYPIQVADQKGSFVIDPQGKKLLDFMSGWSIGQGGWKNPELLNAIQQFNGPSYVPPDFQYKPWEQLAEALVKRMPNNHYTCFKATGGTEAVEIALKTAKAFNGRNQFIAFKDAYHGQSLTELALGGLHEKQFGPYPDNYIRLSTDWKTAKQQALEAIEKQTVCAFISEPIICNLGIVVPPKGFLEDIRKACTQTDTVFIMDEVMTGFGRTGKWFGFEHFDLKPDIVAIAKGFSSGHAVIAATITAQKIAKAMEFDFSNYSSFGWHPLSVAVALANIEYIQQNKLVEKAEKDGAYLSKQLEPIAKTEGKGLCLSFPTTNPRLEEQCLEKGLILPYFRNRALMLPPLTVTKTELDQSVQIIQNCV